MNSKEIQEIEDRYYAKFYARKPISIVRGVGVFVYDAEGKEYVDCSGGYGTCIVGHAHPKVVKAIGTQAEKLISCHASTYNDARAEFLTKLVSIIPSKLNRFFLSNSGAEAVECAIKIARKASGRRKIVTMKGGYHGKTFGALSATWDSKYRKSFEPLVSDFTHIPYGNTEAAKEAITGDTAGVLFEPIQGESGIRVPPVDWVKLLKDLTEDVGGVLIADEIQSGCGRTGKMFAFQHSLIVPDILCIGKGVASGLPIGITTTTDTLMHTLGVGEHTSTFGGNPVVCAAASATIQVLTEEGLVENATRVGEYLEQQLLSIKEDYSIIREIRGLGLMRGVEMRFDVHSIILDALAMGVLLLDAGRNIVRFLPPLCIQKQEVDRVKSVLLKVLEKDQLARAPA